MINRKITRVISVADLKIGGNNPISIQSMTKTDTRDVASTIAQINRLEEAGCEIIRFAVPDMEAVSAIKEIRKSTRLPLVADVHFDYRLAIESIKNGIDKLRINPGNIGGIERIKKVAATAKDHKVPIRIGVNSGSLQKDIYEKHNGATAEALVESALRNIKILEELDFFDICISVKSSSVPLSIEAYALLSQKTDYPLHVGITESGTLLSGSVKSSVGIGCLLLRGIGDTIRVSLTSSPVDEVICAKEILKTLHLRNIGVEITSCPTCGRTQIDLLSIVKEVEKRCASLNKNIRIAVMGCVVDGPGEAREADIGIAGGDRCGVIFRKGRIITKVEEDKLVRALIDEIERM
jgi:(E)-4-hydroxy-3-methylbut-2-enyl-diphosphate synthase